LETYETENDPATLPFQWTEEDGPRYPEEYDASTDEIIFGFTVAPSLCKVYNKIVIIKKRDVYHEQRAELLYSMFGRPPKWKKN